MISQPRDSASTWAAQRVQCQDQSVQSLSGGILEYQIFSQCRIKLESWAQRISFLLLLLIHIDSWPPAGWTPWWQRCFCPGALSPSLPSPCTPRTKLRKMPASQEILNGKSKRSVSEAKLTYCASWTGADLLLGFLHIILLILLVTTHPCFDLLHVCKYEEQLMRMRPAQSRGR